MSFVASVDASATPSLLLIVVDFESIISGLRSQRTGNEERVDVQTVVRALTVFATSFALMQRNNRLCILLFHSFGVEFVYPSRESLSSTFPACVDFVVSLHSLSETISSSFEAIQQEFTARASAPSNVRVGETSTLSSALSTAITIINRQQQLFRVQSRILVLQFDRDVSLNYNAVMNCIFSANKLDTIIDALVMSNYDSHLLQQACYLTGGVYLLPSECDWRNLQLLLQSYFLADKSTRASLSLPTQKTIHFKASCFCHKSPVEMAYMCSVCLTLVCKPEGACVVCGTRARTTTLMT